MHTQRKNSSGPATEKAPTVALSADGRLEESKPSQPGAITLSSKQESNHRDNFNPDIKVHYEPEGISNKVKYSVCMAGEMAAHAGSLRVSAQQHKNDQPTLTIHFPKPDNKTIQVGEKGVMVEHPQCCYGDHVLGVEVKYNPKRNQIIWEKGAESVTIELDTFPKLKETVEKSLKK